MKKIKDYIYFSIMFVIHIIFFLIRGLSPENSYGLFSKDFYYLQKVFIIEKII